jgi:tetratricopeptide (TPR) repeat protein
MQELAPETEKGFEPAHAWVAMDMIQRFGRGELDDRAKASLIHHLKIASTWEKADINLLLVYSGLLESQGQVDEAIKVCRQAANRDSSLHRAVAEICNRAKYTSQASDEAAAAIKVLRVNFGTDLEKETDRVGVARAHLVRNEPDEAIKTLAEGLQFKPDRPMVKRMLSEVLRLKYRSSFRQTASGIELNMNLLEAAANVDPGNPAVGEEIAQLSQMGVAASENTMDTLKKQLANGTASAITHTLLGNAYASRSIWPKAISHWELALGQNPNLVIVLNNLAVALTEQDPTNASRSLEMIDKALKIVGGNNAELFDSRGLILLAAGQPKEAISWFEKSLSLDANRVATREGMVKAAEQAGIPDLVEIHSKALAELKEKLAKEAEEKKNSASSSVPDAASKDSPEVTSPANPTIETKATGDGNSSNTDATTETTVPK